MLSAFADKLATSNTVKSRQFLKTIFIYVPFLQFACKSTIFIQKLSHSPSSFILFLSYYPILFADAGMRIHKAMLLHAKSNALGRWEHCFQMLGAMLSGAGSNALGVQKQCSKKPKAMPYGIQGNDISTRKACFQHPEAGLFVPPPYWGGLGWGSISLPLGRQRWRVTPLLRRGRGRFYFTTTFFPLRI